MRHLCIYSTGFISYCVLCCSLRVKYPLNLCFTSPTQNSPLWLEKVHPRSPFISPHLVSKKRGQFGGIWGRICLLCFSTETSNECSSVESVFLLSLTKSKCLRKGRWWPYKVVKLKAHQLKAEMKEVLYLNIYIKMFWGANMV